MSGTPNLCVDIFTQIANMMGQLQRVSTDPNNTFTHGGGFTNTGPVEPEPSTPSEATNLLAWVFIAVLVFFLMFGNRSREPEDLKARMRRRNLDDDNNDNSDIH